MSSSIYPKSVDPEEQKESMENPEGLEEFYDSLEARWWDNPQNAIVPLPSEEDSSYETQSQ